MREESKQGKSIRFITSDYTDLFRMEDGGTILVTFPDRQFIEKCEYIDDYHVKIGNSVYHICEYAEILERNGGRCEIESETTLEKAAWKIGRGDYLIIERTENGFRYEVLTKEFLSKAQGWIDHPSWTMNHAREHVLESIGLCRFSRTAIPYEMVAKRAEEVLKVSDVRMIEWKDSRYYPGMRTAEHTLTCEIRGETALLTYEVSRHDDGEDFVIHSDGKDIWDIMPESELRKLDPILAEAVEYGHWKRDLDQAGTVEAVREVRYGLYESENLIMSKEQIGKLHEAIDRKEAMLSAAQKAPVFGRKQMIMASAENNSPSNEGKDYPKSQKTRRR